MSAAGSPVWAAGSPVWAAASLGRCRHPTNLSHAHPVLVATHAAMFDRLAKGRFILGIRPGALPSDAEALGILGEDRNKMFAESIDVILKIWDSDPPYDIDLPDNRFKVSSKQSFDKLTATDMCLTAGSMHLSGAWNRLLPNHPLKTIGGSGSPEG